MRKRQEHNPPGMKPWLLACAMGAIMASSPVVALADLEPARRMVQINDAPTLALIGSLEGPDGYDDFYGGSPLAPPRPLTTMTIGEVLEFQDKAVAAGSRSSAAGRYQFIRSTLRELIKTGRISEAALFDRRTQNYLARLMLASCGFYDPSRTEIEIGNCLSQVWAALPVMSGKKAGRSYYHGIAGNRALTTTRKLGSVISSRTIQPSLGATPIPVGTQAPAAPPRQRVATVITFPDDGRMTDRIPLR